MLKDLDSDAKRRPQLNAGVMPSWGQSVKRAKSDMIVLNARYMTRDEAQDIRVNRDSELDACVHHLNHCRGNAFLWGARGVRKTFLVRLIEAELRKEASVLPVNVDVLGLPGFGRRDAATAFPEAVLLAICLTIWKDVLDKPYSQLRARLDLRKGDLRLSSKLARKVEALYVHVMASERKAHYEYSHSVGFSAGAKGEKKETGWVEQEQPPILPFEFLEFCEEILGVLERKGKTRVIALCDEANLLSFEQQRDILGRYIEVFASRRIQFLFVAGPHRSEPVPPPIPEGFDLVLEMTGLQPGAAAQLLSKVATRSGLELEPKSAAIAQARLEGNPRLLLLALGSAMSKADESNKITSRMIEAACSEVLAREQLYRSMLPSGRRTPSEPKENA